MVKKYFNDEERRLAHNEAAKRFRERKKQKDALADIRRSLPENQALFLLTLWCDGFHSVARGKELLEFRSKIQPDDLLQFASSCEALWEMTPTMFAVYRDSDFLCCPPSEKATVAGNTGLDGDMLSSLLKIISDAGFVISRR